MRFHTFRYYAIKDNEVVAIFTKYAGTKSSEVEAFFKAHADCDIKSTMHSYNI